MKKIESIEELAETLSNNLIKKNIKDTIVLQTIIDTTKSKEPSVVFNGEDTVTYVIPGCSITEFKLFKETNEKQYFLYTDKQNLCYTNDNIKDKGIALHNRIILKKPTYDEVYDFLYKYYICPLTLNKEKYKSLNKIFRRRNVKL